MTKAEEFRINREIKEQTVRITDDGLNVVLSLEEALKMANDKQMDLIEINRNSSPVICKIAIYDKFLYDRKKKQREMDKINRQNKQELKELKFGPNIDAHDYEFKKNHAIKFLEDGDKVKLSVMYKGREMRFQEKGYSIFSNLIEDLKDIAKVDQQPRLEGNTLICILSPKK